MADLSPTAASIASGPNAVTRSGYAGAAIAQGEAVYFDPYTNRFRLAIATGTELQAACVGIALSEATGDGQPIQVQTAGWIKGMGQTEALIYILSSTAGALSPHTDATTPASTEFCTIVGVGVDATYFNIVIGYGGQLA